MVEHAYLIALFPTQIMDRPFGPDEVALTVAARAFLTQLDTIAAFTADSGQAPNVLSLAVFHANVFDFVARWRQWKPTDESRALANLVYSLTVLCQTWVTVDAHSPLHKDFVVRKAEIVQKYMRLVGLARTRELMASFAIQFPTLQW